MRSLIVVPALLLIATSAPASDDASAGVGVVSLRPFVGAYIPTGDQKKVLSSSVLTGAQLGYTLPAPIRLVGTVAWTPAKNKDLSDTRTNIFQYDAGVEVASSPAPSAEWAMVPFAGVGLGARTYRFKDLSSSDQTNIAGYGALGGEVVRSGMGARLEVRDYLSRFKEIEAPNSTSTRNDLALTLALDFHL